jgi:hypothetical protein
MEEEVKDIDKVEGEPDQGAFEMDEPVQPHPALEHRA